MEANPSKDNKTMYAYKLIKAAILGNEYRPGQIISENSLVKKLEVSRTPVREAIKILETEGLVQIYKGVGVLVKHITVREVRDTCELRVLLECYAMKRACGQLLPWQIGQMIDKWQNLLERILTNGDYTQKEITEMDVATHDLVFENAKNDVLSNIHEDMHGKITRYQALFTTLVNDDANTARQHIDLLNALMEKDEARYKSLLEEQVYTPILSMRNNLWE